MNGSSSAGAAIVAALDANHDGVIDADEIANAPAALKSLDKNGDGKLTPDEFMGKRPGPPHNSAAATKPVAARWSAGRTPPANDDFCSSEWKSGGLFCKSRMQSSQSAAPHFSGNGRSGVSADRRQFKKSNRKILTGKLAASPESRYEIIPRTAKPWMVCQPYLLPSRCIARIPARMEMTRRSRTATMRRGCKGSQRTTGRKCAPRLRRFAPRRWWRLVRSAARDLKVIRKAAGASGRCRWPAAPAQKHFYPRPIGAV